MKVLKFSKFFFTTITIFYLFPFFLRSEYTLISFNEFEDLLVLTAKSAKEKQKGLMFLKKLKRTNGMIFLYKEPQVVKIWMKNTLLSLDIIFVDKKKKIISIKEGIKLTENIISSDFPVIAVVEIPRDCSEKIGLKVGDKISWRKFEKKQISKKFLSNQKKFPFLN